MSVTGLLFALILPFQATSQPDDSLRASDLGVVWMAPESSILASADLEEMHTVGIRIVRTGPVRDRDVLETADSLGIVLYRELPMLNYPAGRLVDSTRYAARILAQLIDAGRGFASAGPIGLATNADVSDPAACAYFSDVRRGLIPEDAQQFYYVSPYVENDACRESVDFVLVDALDQESPVDVLDGLLAGGFTNIGMASVGWRVESGAFGIGWSHSPEEQARSLEHAVSRLAGRDLPRPVFVHRWRDQTSRLPGEISVWDVYGRKYGLLDADRTRRPSFGVLAAYLKSGQDVFAFPASREPSFTFPWYIILGWLMLVTVAVLYASSPRFRYMVPRYFIAHGFFRNAVREAREVLPIVSTALLSVMGVAIGLVGTQVFLALHDTAPARFLTASLSGQVQSVLEAMLAGPLLSVFLIGSVALLATSAWMGLWMIVASRKAPLLPSQALMLGVWPRWQLLLLLPMAMSIHSAGSPALVAWTTVLITLWFGTALWASMRTAYDLVKITRCHPVLGGAVWMLNPTNLVFLAVLIVIAFHADETAFFWHLVWRG